MRLQERFESFIEKTEGCWEWTGLRSEGVGRRPMFRLAGRRLVAARVAYELYRDEVPRNLCVCHRCDNGSCVNPAHLWLGTHAENMADASRKGRMHPGEASKQAKLTERQVREIVALYRAGGISTTRLAKRFGVGHTAIHDIVSGRNWKHLGLVPRA